MLLKFKCDKIIIKRLFDIVFSILGIFVLAPVYIIVYISIKLFMKDGPVVFKQKRVGKYGDFFTIYKFRTMSNEYHSSTITVGGESHITNIGKVLRKYKLDEIPELLNVLVGDMSFVGPRPDVPGYADKLQGEDRRILEFRPGITGLASLKYAKEEQILADVDDPIKYNNDVIFPDKVQINLDYCDNWSLWLDTKIIFKTIFRNNY